jgi:hypothetical protein
MKKLFLFLLAVIFFAGSMNYAQEIPKIWSKLTEDASTIPVPPDPNYTYKPAPQIERNFMVKNGLAVVYPNYRPLPSPTATQSELSIDIHPLNANIIFASANATPWPVSGIYGTGVYWTLDGGATNWSGFNNPPFGGNSGDPASAIGSNGYFYEGFIHSNGGQGAARSTNNGATWTAYLISTVSSSSDLLDKNHLWIDKKVGSPYANRVYSAWTRFQSGHPNNNKVEVSYSSNNGETWSTPANVSAGVNSGSHDQGVNIQTGPNGEVYVTWAIYDQWGAGVYGEDAIGFNVSTDGGATWGVARRIYAAANFGIRGNLKSTAIRVSSFPSMGVNRTTGHIYITWPQKTVAPAGTSPDIVLIKSLDGGLTWSAPVRVNDDPIANGKDQYYPWLTVDQTTGHVYSVFYDSRNVNNDSAEVYIARSIDGGTTFENIKVSDAKFKPKPISGLAGGYQGDYIGIAALNNTVWPYWADDRTGNYQGWVAKATFGPNIIHTPLSNTENLAGPYVVNTTIESTLPLINNRLYVYYWRDSSPKDSVLLTNVSGNQFTANIPGNGTQATYHYYISAEDNTGGVSTLPGGAPANNFTFEARTDIIPPQIVHTVISNQYRENWPATVSAVVTDNIGVDSVWVVYKIGTNPTMRQFRLSTVTGNTYSGVFNVDTTLIAVGDTLSYRIAAVDISAAHNVGYHPTSTGFNKFVFIADSDLPVIAHSPLRDQPIIRWPAQVKTSVTDILGVLSVSVEFSKNNGTTSSFNLTNTGGTNWAAAFPLDSSQIDVGDTIAYRIKAVDNSTLQNFSYLPASGYFKFKIIATKGIVLVVNDETTLLDRSSSEKGEGDLRAALGVGSTLIASTLIQSGFVVDTVTFAAMDVSTLNNYDIVALSAGLKTSSIFEDQAKRNALVAYNVAGGKVFVEGGEVGYVYRQSGTTTDKDPLFRRTILRDSTWLSDISTGLIKKRIPYHPIFNVPNYVADSCAFGGTTFGYRDVVTTMRVPGVYKLASWWGTYADSAGIIAYSPTNDTNYVTNIFCTFAIGGMTNLTLAGKLVENLFEYLTFGYSIIPVELVSFSANQANGAVNLTWQTATELNNSGFEVERRTDGTLFSKLAFIPGKGTTTNVSSYSFIDDNVASGNYTYRLKQIDYDGTVNYSKEVSVNVSTPDVFELSQNYPNPFNPSTSIKFSVPADGMVTLVVYNLLGEQITTLLNQEMKAGRHEVSFDASRLSSGLYFYRLDAGNFSSVKKMMLLK